MDQDKCRVKALEGCSLQQTSVSHPSLAPPPCTEKPGTGQVPVAAPGWLRALASDPILGPGITLSAFFFPALVPPVWLGTVHTLRQLSLVNGSL